MRSRRDARREAMRRRASVALWPTIEGLEGRALMANFGLDPTFGDDGRLVVPIPGRADSGSLYAIIDDVILQPDGKILGVGGFRHQMSSAPYTVRTDVLVERFNSDGSLDVSYGSGGMFVAPGLKFGDGTLDANVEAAILQSDGSIVVVAHADGLSSGADGFPVRDFAVMRVLPDGTLDTSFGDGGYTLIDFGPDQTSGDQYDRPKSIALGPDGSIVVAGYTALATKDVGGTSFPNSSDFAVARLLPDGTLDGSFGDGGKRTIPFNLGGNNSSWAYGVAVRADGAIVLVGKAEVGAPNPGAYNHNTSDIAVARLTPRGDLDATFGAGGLVTIDHDLYEKGNAVVLLNDEIVIVDDSATLTRIAADGTILGTLALNLNRQGDTFYDAGETLNVLPDSTILMGGTVSSGGRFGQFFTNLLPDGSVNTAYGTEGFAIFLGAFAGGSVAVQPDGKVLFGFGAGRTIVRTMFILDADPPGNGGGDPTGAGPTAVNNAQAPAASAPAVQESRLVFAGSSKKTNTIAIRFNTTLDPALAARKSTYKVRIGKKGRRFAAIRRVSYDAATRSVTITLKQKFNRKAQLFVLIAPNRLAGPDGRPLGDGRAVVIPIAAAG